jgi:hypothetical protein
MRALRPLCVLAMAMSSSSVAIGQEPPISPRPGGDTALEVTLVGLERQSWEAWQKRDGKFFDGFLSDDHVDVHSGGPSGKKAVVAGVSSPACVVRSYSVSDFTLTPLASDAALLVYRAEQDTTCGGHVVPSPSWVSSVYVRRDGRWRNALFQVTDATSRK